MYLLYYISINILFHAFVVCPGSRHKAMYATYKF